MGLNFNDFGDDDERKRQFAAKTTRGGSNGNKKEYSMTVELEDWPIANFPSASSKTYTNNLKWKFLSSKKKKQSLSTIS